MITIVNLGAWFLVAAAVGPTVTTIGPRLAARPQIAWQKRQGVRGMSFWRWQTALTYLVVLWGVERLLIRSRERQHEHRVWGR